MTWREMNACLALLALVDAAIPSNGLAERSSPRRIAALKYCRLLPMVRRIVFSPSPAFTSDWRNASASSGPIVRMSRFSPKWLTRYRRTCFRPITVAGFRPGRPARYSSMNAPSVTRPPGRGLTSPAATSRRCSASGNSASQRAVSSSISFPPQAAATRSSIFTLKASACFMLALPRRIVFRLPSAATNRIRFLPLGSLPIVAIVHLSFRRRLAGSS
ncbi:hypothetical protein [Fontivita pretiosa]|uniref:hypothetical protein n=1 Tax=Fontivita pretiosa TaxID=2989684 RepID=UPI003D183E3B